MDPFAEPEEEEPAPDYQELFDEVWAVLDEAGTGELSWNIVAILFRLLGISEEWIAEAIPQAGLMDKKTAIVKRRMSICKLEYVHPQCILLLVSFASSTGMTLNSCMLQCNKM